MASREGEKAFAPGQGRGLAGIVTKVLRFKINIYVRIAVTLAVMLGLVFVVMTFGVPNPNMILIMGLVVCAALFGWAGGIVAAAIMIGYTLVFFSNDGALFTYSAQNIQKVVVSLLGVGVVTFFVCALRQSENRVFAQIDHMAELLREDNEQLEEASVADALTGLRNRFALRRDYPKLMDTSDELYVMMVDVDDFKAANDEHGHDFGDYVLGEMGHIIADCFGPEHSYRYGGDEFLVIEPGATEESFEAQIDEMREHIGDIKVEGIDFEVRFSAGYVHGRPTLHSDLRTMFRQADEQLYESKRKGKNRSTGAPFIRSSAKSA